MDDVEGARSFHVEGSSYDSFMGRYSLSLATAFLDAVGVQPGGVALDVGCGPGALVSALVTRLGPDAVLACDPAPSFVEECGRRHLMSRAELLAGSIGARSTTMNSVRSAHIPLSAGRNGRHGSDAPGQTWWRHELSMKSVRSALVRAT